MKVLETNLSFSHQLKNRSKTGRLIIHHAATDGDVSASAIHQWHLGRGWSGIGYHYVIRTNGVIERGRPENTIGAHAGSTGNSDSIGICLAGNFTREEPSLKQIEALVGLIKDVMSRYGELDVIRHKDVMATQCPGDKFPWSKLMLALKIDAAPAADAWKIDIMNSARKAGLITSEHNPDDPADKWFVLAVALNLLKSLKS